MRVLGIDAAGRLGWAAIVLDGGRFVDARTGDLADLIAWAEPLDAIGIDIPIGNLNDRPRSAERGARTLLGRRASTIFNAPPLFVLDAPSQAAANELCVARGWPKLSAQAWNLVPKVNEASALAADDDRIIEVHPELSFMAMADVPPLPSKKTWTGALQRINLLAAAGIEIPVGNDAGKAPTDDVLDAAAVAWTVDRYANGIAVPLPEEIERDEAGRRLAVWF